MPNFTGRTLGDVKALLGSLAGSEFIVPNTGLSLMEWYRILNRFDLSSTTNVHFNEEIEQDCPLGDLVDHLVVWSEQPEGHEAWCQFKVWVDRLCRREIPTEYWWTHSPTSSSTPKEKYTPKFKDMLF